MDESRTKARRCPFCGHEPYIEEEGFLVPETRDHQIWSANCCDQHGGCGAQILGVSRDDVLSKWEGRYLDNMDVKKAAFEQWHSQHFLDELTKSKGGSDYQSGVVRDRWEGFQAGSDPKIN